MTNPLATTPQAVKTRASGPRRWSIRRMVVWTKIRPVACCRATGRRGRSAGAGEGQVNDINMVLDIPVQLSVELGRTRVSIKHILQLGQGSVVELDALAGEPMDVLVNGYLIAQGEVVVVNDKFGIRLTDVVTPSERLRRINKG